MLGGHEGKGEERKKPVEVGREKKRILYGKRSGLRKNKEEEDKFGGFNEKR